MDQEINMVIYAKSNDQGVLQRGDQEACMEE